jgi:hypothetical protein
VYSRRQYLNVFERNEVSVFWTKHVGKCDGWKNGSSFSILDLLFYPEDGSMASLLILIKIYQTTRHHISETVLFVVTTVKALVSHICAFCCGAVELFLTTKTIRKCCIIFEHILGYVGDFSVMGLL